MENRAKEIAQEYIRLGGRRLAAFDDNLASTRTWEADSAEAADFWKERVEPLDAKAKRDVQSFLPAVNDK